MAPETLDVLRHYAWPGNVRELQSLLKQALLHATGPVLLPDFLPAALRTPKDSSPAVPDIPFPDWERFLTDRLHAGSTEIYAEALTAMERQLLTLVLRHTGETSRRPKSWALRATACATSYARLASPLHEPCAHQMTNLMPKRLMPMDPSSLDRNRRFRRDSSAISPLCSKETWPWDSISNLPDCIVRHRGRCVPELSPAPDARLWRSTRSHE